uniref:Uncharacterized protein n=1 Tax=Lepeophtheirus salmonis TaxID=72036 RepID=A0A0K2T3D0_LEPSM
MGRRQNMLNDYQIKHYYSVVFLMEEVCVNIYSKEVLYLTFLLSVLPSDTRLSFLFLPSSPRSIQ